MDVKYYFYSINLKTYTYFYRARKTTERWKDSVKEQLGEIRADWVEIVERK